MMMNNKHYEEDISRQESRRKKERKSHTLMMRMAMGQDVGATIMMSTGQDRNTNSTYRDKKPDVSDTTIVDEHRKKAV